MNNSVAIPDSLIELFKTSSLKTDPDLVIGEYRSVYDAELDQLDTLMSQLITNGDYVVNWEGKKCNGLFFRSFVSTLNKSYYLLNELAKPNISEELYTTYKAKYDTLFQKYYCSDAFYNYLITNFEDDSLMPFTALYALYQTRGLYTNAQTTLAKVLRACDIAIAGNVVVNFADISYQKRDANVDIEKAKVITKDFLSATYAYMKIYGITHLNDSTYTDDELAAFIWQTYEPYKNHIADLDILSNHNAFYDQGNSMYTGRAANALSKLIDSAKYTFDQKMYVYFMFIAARTRYLIKNAFYNSKPAELLKAQLASNLPYSLSYPENTKDAILYLFIDKLTEDNGFVEVNTMLEFIGSINLLDYFIGILSNRADNVAEDLYHYKGDMNKDVTAQFIANLKAIKEDKVKTVGLKMLFKTCTSFLDVMPEIIDTYSDDAEKRVALSYMESVKSLTNIPQY